jgi:hypothetical protein
MTAIYSVCGWCGLTQRSPAIAPNRGLHTTRPKPLGERRDPVTGARPARVAGGVVERDEIDVRAASEPGQAPRERIRLMREVVDAADARVLERDPSTLAFGVGAGRVEHCGEWITAVQRHELFTQRVVGRVQRDRERDRQVELGEPFHAGNDADRRDREVAGRDADVLV